MSKFLFLYRGPATQMDQFTPEQSAEAMQAWGTWMERLGPALTDAGSPFGTRDSVAGDGSTATPSDQNGYSIVEAENLAAARALTDKHPFLTGGDSRFSVEIFELVPM
jgi:hypothetical protein